MLARANRLIRAADFREVVRRGRRFASPAAVYYVLEREEGAPLRFGVIVSAAVGGAVDRNRLRRRYRALGREHVEGGRRGADVVIRVLPGARSWSFEALSADLDRGMSRLAGGVR